MSSFTELLVILPGGTAFAVGYLLFCMEVAPMLADAARMACRVVRLLFLAVGWAVMIARLLL